MKVRQLSKLFVVIACGSFASACATTPSVTRSDSPDAARERGLGDLRRELAMAPPSGRVVAGADGQWLVHAASGKRLVRMPGGEWDAKPVAGLTMLFEGTPGAALVFDH